MATENDRCQASASISSTEFVAMHVIHQFKKKKKRIMLSYDQSAAAMWVSSLSAQNNAVFFICAGHKEEILVTVKTSSLCFSEPYL